MFLDKEKDFNRLFGHYDRDKFNGFWDFHMENPEVYSKFYSLAKKMQSTGRKRYSAKSIFEVMRWELDLKTSDEKYKINNNYHSFYARLVIYYDPTFETFFELRVQSRDAAGCYSPGYDVHDWWN